MKLRSFKSTMWTAWPLKCFLGFLVRGGPWSFLGFETFLEFRIAFEAATGTGGGHKCQRQQMVGKGGWCKGRGIMARWVSVAVDGGCGSCTRVPTIGGCGREGVCTTTFRWRWYLMPWLLHHNPTVKVGQLKQVSSRLIYRRSLIYFIVAGASVFKSSD
jgi:hypothetical protein